MSEIAAPMAVLNVIVLLGIVRMWWTHKECRKRLCWIAIPFFILYFIHTWPVRYLIVGSLEWRYPLSETVDREAEAIVVLSGAIHAADPVRPFPELGANTIERCLHAAKLHKAAPDMPILVSGGPLEGEGGPIAASLMHDFLIRQGVNEQKIIMEEQSRTTYENAVETAKILREKGIRRVILVTSATHMKRSVGTFEKQGLHVAPSACGHIANEYHFDWTDLFPDAASAHHVGVASHEWLGVVLYRIRGRI